MTTDTWIALGGLTLGLIGLQWRWAEGLRGWARELFAARADLARLEARIDALAARIEDVQQTTHEIRDLLQRRDR